MAFPSYTYTFTNGSTADATQVNQNFTDILNGISDTTKDISINALTTAGTATLNGNVTLGNGTGKSITFSGSVASNIPVSANTSWDFGGATLGMRSYYIGGTSTFSTRLMSAATSSYTLTFPVAVAATNQILKSDSSGNLSWVDPGNLTVLSKTTTYGASNGDSIIFCSGSAFTVTLPTAAGITGNQFRIKKTDASLTNIITIATTSSQTIGENSATTFTLNTQDECLVVVSDGSNWRIVDHFIPSVWTSVTPTGTLVTNCTYSGHWKRVGDSIIYQFKILIAGVPGATNPINVNIPSNMLIDTTKLDTSTTFYVLNGFGDYFGSANSLRYILAATYVSTSAITLKTSGSSLGSFTDQSPSIMANTDFIYFTVTLPISGWNG